MGFDIYGISPVESEDHSSPGEYFRNNIWWWRPLWAYILKVCPDLNDDEKESGFHNHREQIGKKSAKYIKNVLEKEINSGKCFTYQTLHNAKMNALEDEQCSICIGIGERENWTGYTKLFKDKAKDSLVKCNACSGKGKVRPFETNYPFTVENVQDFVRFLEHSNGFQIC